MRTDDKRGSSQARARRKLWLLEEFGNGVIAYCTWCKHWITSSTMHVDRVVPGGSYKRDNIIPSCATCNMNRKDKSIEEYLDKCANPVYAIMVLKEAGFLPSSLDGGTFVLPSLGSTQAALSA